MPRLLSGDRHQPEQAVRAARVDANQAAIVKALRAAGCSVQPIHRCGEGVPDLLVGYARINWLLECKDGKKPPSARELTPDQIDWHIAWRGQVAVVNSVEEALLLVTAKETV